CPAQVVGCKVTATDFRSAAAVVIAGLLAEGRTEIHGVEHIERGYSKIIEKLSAIGADITRSSTAETNI
ncbi:UDP-N-acetylglucosamine 1-carboxyvinyltransferase, partial [Escherichia coli]|nr:UDP-N-acetylglucosamine 1-carboxyvinyltransferase [Escherichia coli]